MEVIIGIDISKKTMDWCTLRGSEKPRVLKVANNEAAITANIEYVAASQGVETKDLLLCAEYTNIYWYPLANVCERLGVQLWMENAYNISLQTKRKREKSDSADACQIALYARRFGDEMISYRPKPKNIMLLRQMLRVQADCDRMAGKYKGRISDTKGFLPEELLRTSAVTWEAMQNTAREQSAIIEKQIEKLISEDPTLKHQDELLRSIPGVGKKTAHMMIAETAGFTTFVNARKFCTQAGFATFSRTSGTSINSGDHVSHRCDHRVKRYIHLAGRAAGTICKSGPLQEYYHRKLKEGKSKMSALNAVCAKLITIMFAVIRDNKPFDPNHKYQPGKV